MSNIATIYKSSSSRHDLESDRGIFSLSIWRKIHQDWQEYDRVKYWRKKKEKYKKSFVHCLWDYQLCSKGWKWKYRHTNLWSGQSFRCSVTWGLYERCMGYTSTPGAWWLAGSGVPIPMLVVWFWVCHITYFTLPYRQYSGNGCTRWVERIW